jgi:predicted patatin/cPLA2 family phospholipase
LRQKGIKRAETDPAQLQRVYDIGIKDANDNLEAMKVFLGR